MLTRCLVLLAVTLALTIRLAAQPTTSALLPVGPRTEEDQTNYGLYKKFLELYVNDEPAAYVVAEQYLQRYPEASEQNAYLKRWVADFVARRTLLRKQNVRMLIDNRRFDEAFVLGREVLKSEPRDFGTLVNLTDAALTAFAYGDSRYIEDAVGYAKTALNLIESKQVSLPEPEKIMAWLSRVLGTFKLAHSPSEAAAYFDKALEYQTFRDDPFIYAYLADSLLASEYAPLQVEYSQYRTQQEKNGPRAQELRARINTVTDRVIDLLARAVKLAGYDAYASREKLRWLTLLTDLYKFRNSGFETGLSEYLDAILDKPFARRLRRL